MGCIMFDPAFSCNYRKSLTEDNDSNKINKRFGCFLQNRHYNSPYVDSSERNLQSIETQRTSDI